MRLRILSLIVMGIAWLTGAASASAEFIQWAAPGSGLFQNPNNWDPNQVPTIVDDVLVANGSSPTITFSASAFSSSFSVTADNVILELGSNGYVIDHDVSIASVGPLGIGALGTPQASLAVNNGALNVMGQVIVAADAALTGTGIVNTGQVSLNGGQLRGSLTVNGGVANFGGAVAPGVGRGTLVVNGPYEQDPDALLEIEAAGTTPNTQYDVLQVNGNTFLAGRLELPIITGYTPMPGHTLANFLQGTSVAGAFDYITAPNLPGATVALQFTTTPTSMTASFVTPGLTNMDQEPLPQSWGNPGTWSGGVPTTSTAVSLFSAASFPTRVSLDLSAARAFAHSVSLNSLSPAFPVTLGVPEGTSVSALYQMNVAANGIVELTGGQIHSPSVKVDGGGTMVGDGRVAGDLTLGDGGSGAATLHATAEIQVDEDFVINSEGVLAVDVNSVSDFGRVTAQGNVTAGGTLRMDVSNLDSGTPVDTEFQIIAADFFDGTFDTIETVGAGRTMFLAPFGVQALGDGGCQIGALLDCNTNGYLYSRPMGDMNLDGLTNDADAADFAQALVTPGTYKNQHCNVTGTSSGDYNGDLRLDFDDIAFFVNDVETLSVADMMALIAEASVPEPASGGLVLLALAVGGLLRLPSSRRQALR